MRHPSQDNLLEFASGQASEAGAEAIYAHLDECPACSERLAAIRRLRADFDGSWEGFLAEFHLRAAASASEVPAAAREISVLPDEVSAGADELATLPGAEAVLTFRGLLDGARRLATAARDRLVEGLEEGQAWGAVFQPAFSGTGDAEQDPRARELTREAAELVSRGEDLRARQSLEAAARLQGDAAAFATQELSFRGKPVGKLIVQAERRSVSVLVKPEAIGARRARVLLRSGVTDSTGKVPRSDAAGRAAERSAFLEPVQGADYLLAEFTGVPDGSFSVRLEVLD